MGSYLLNREEVDKDQWNLLNMYCYNMEHLTRKEHLQELKYLLRKISATEFILILLFLEEK